MKTWTLSAIIAARSLDVTQSTWMSRATRLALFLLAAGGPGDASTLLTAQPKSPWITVTQVPALRVSLDTSRIHRDMSGAEVWLRFDYSSTKPPMVDMPKPWRRVEYQVAINCARRRAKNLTMIVVDTLGGRHNGTAAIGAGWQTFEQHPLTSAALVPLCAKLGPPSGSRGA